MKPISDRTKLKYFTAAVFGLIVIGYAVYQMRNLIDQPLIIIDSPVNGSRMISPIVIIKGRVEQITKLFLNGESLTPDHTGHFESQLLLAQGYNILRFNGEDRFGREVQQKLELVLP